MASDPENSSDLENSPSPRDAEMLGLYEHRDLVEQLPHRLWFLVTDGVISADEARAWIDEAREGLGRRRDAPTGAVTTGIPTPACRDRPRPSSKQRDRTRSG